jgi:hypothetical protein
MPESLRPITAAAIEQVRKDLMDALTELAYHVKADFVHDREQLRKLHNENVELRQRLDELQYQAKLVSGQ